MIARNRHVCSVASAVADSAGPGGEVSWKVMAIRNDRWVRERGAPVEIEKEGLEKGTYQHPELYGQPPEKGMNYDATGAGHARPELPVGRPAAPTG